MSFIFPQVNSEKTGLKIKTLRKQNKMSVADLQQAMYLESPQAVYKWERGESLPSIENLVILSKLFKVTINDILVIDNM